MVGYYDWEESSRNAHTLSKAVSFFNENGYVIFSSFCTASEVSSLRGRAGEIVHSFQTSSGAEIASVFTTEDQKRDMEDQYFLSSAENVSCFLEMKQLAGEPAAVNKIGHALHDTDDAFQTFSRQDKVRAVAEALGVRDAVLVQSMYILKNPRVGGEVRAHRDASFVRGPDGRCVGYWWALEDATTENGCLWAVPGSHLEGGARRRMVLEEGKTRFEGDENAEEGVADERFVALPVAAGDLVMLHGEVVHKSFENRSEKSRHAYSIHVVSGGIAGDCWLQRSEELPFRAL